MQQLPFQLTLQAAATCTTNARAAQWTLPVVANSTFSLTLETHLFIKKTFFND